jgi:hypothetical protein
VVEVNEITKGNNDMTMNITFTNWAIAPQGLGTYRVFGTYEAGGFFADVRIPNMVDPSQRFDSPQYLKGNYQGDIESLLVAAVDYINSQF